MPQLPVVERINGRFRVAVHPKCHIWWWVEQRSEGSILIIETDSTLREFDGDGRSRAEWPIRNLPQ
jgi:hypothetical protein